MKAGIVQVSVLPILQMIQLPEQTGDIHEDRFAGHLVAVEINDVDKPYVAFFRRCIIAEVDYLIGAKMRGSVVGQHDATRTLVERSRKSVKIRKGFPEGTTPICDIILFLPS
jgi:hypothetical protein